MLDNLDRTAELIVMLEAYLPLDARMSPQLTASLAKDIPGLTTLQPCRIVSVFYGGEKAGIKCVAELVDHELTDAEKNLFMVSITLLSFDRRHPLTHDIVRYQKNRTKRMKRELGYAPRVTLVEHQLPAD